MNNHFWIALLLLGLLAACRVPQKSYLIKIYAENDAGVDSRSGYINAAGDTIVPVGYYVDCLSDTIENMGLVLTKDYKFVALNQNGAELFEVFTYDNGPDYIADGLFRIIRNDKIGYADESGTIIIEPQFACAFPFENGEAKVALECTTTKEGEHSFMESDRWMMIDKTGAEIKK